MKRYDGSVWVCTAGSEFEHALSRDSISRITLRQGDVGPYFGRGTKGYEVRQAYLNKFIESNHDFICFLDHDMTFPPDTLERLRSHGLPYVSGVYMRRKYDPVAPIWFDNNPDGAFPFRPYLDIPRRKEGSAEYDLEPIGASGWGCILLHREVVLAVRELLKGEPDILEDDMDIWPYDLHRIMASIHGLAELATKKPDDLRLFQTALRYHVKVLQEEIKPLQVGKKTVIGSDIRYPFFAREAGYQLWGDPNINCGHLITYPLVFWNDWTSLSADIHQLMRENQDEAVTKGRREWQERLVALARAGHD